MQVSTAQYRRMIDALLRAKAKGDLAAIAILEGQLKRVVW
jgi:hypothetical protein